jgi:hypothetical protein
MYGSGQLYRLEESGARKKGGLLEISANQYLRKEEVCERGKQATAWMV